MVVDVIKYNNTDLIFERFVNVNYYYFDVIAFIWSVVFTPYNFSLIYSPISFFKSKQTRDYIFAKHK